MTGPTFSDAHPTRMPETINRPWGIPVPTTGPHGLLDPDCGSVYQKSEPTVASGVPQIFNTTWLRGRDLEAHTKPPDERTRGKNCTRAYTFRGRILRDDRSTDRTQDHRTSENIGRSCSHRLSLSWTDSNLTVSSRFFQRTDALLPLVTGEMHSAQYMATRWLAIEA